MTLLAAYSFDTDGSDATGNGHGFTLGAGLTLQTGHTNTGLRHESTAADSAGPAIFGQTAQRTLMCWVKRTSNSVDGWIVEMKDGGGNTGVWGFLFTSGNVQARTKNPSSTVFTVQTTQPTVNVWYHIAMTFDGTKLHLYINGTEVGTGTTVTGGALITSATIFPFMDTVGTETVIDDVRIYDTALSGAQITTDMNTPVSAGSTNTGTIAATFSSMTAAMAATSKVTGSVSGSMSSVTATAAGIAKATGSVAGTMAGTTASFAGTGKVSAALSGVTSGVSAAFSALGRVNGVLSGVFSAMTAAFSAGPAPASGVLDGTMAPVDASFSGLAKASGVINGTFAVPVFAGTGGVPMSNRDILVTIGPGERPATLITAGTASRTSVTPNDFKRTEIGAT